jgi:hypothetical protein
MHAALPATDKMCLQSHATLPGMAWEVPLETLQVDVLLEGHMCFRNSANHEAAALGALMA